MASDINFVRLAEHLTDHYHGSIIYSPHGPAHWRRVEQNGLLLATKTGADVVVVKLFAIFHDCCRLNDGTDEGHGARGAVYAAQLRGEYFEMEDAAFALLHEACAGHTDCERSEDATIGTCWDADRLDLGAGGDDSESEVYEHGFWAGDCAGWEYSTFSGKAGGRVRCEHSLG